MKPILIRPVYTEKSLARAQQGLYTFIVSKKSTKKQVAHAIEKEFNVHVQAISTVTTPGKTKRTGRKRMLSKTSGIKKAIVKLNPNEKIGLFEVSEKGKK